MYHIHYNKESGKILGFYTNDVSSMIPSPTIQVSLETKKEVERRPHRFAVKDNQLIETKEILAVNSERKDVSEFEFQNGVYCVDRMFLSNLTLNLSISQRKRDHTCKFWCNVDGEFIKREHDADELMQLAQTYESARSALMGE